MSTNQAPSQFDNPDELADLMCYAVMDILHFEYLETPPLCHEIITRLAQSDWWAEKDETDIAKEFQFLLKRNGSKRAKYSVFWNTFECLRKEGIVSVFRYVQRWDKKRFDFDDWKTTRPSEIAILSLISLAVMKGFLAVEKDEIASTKVLLDIFSGKQNEAQSNDLKEE
jgi:hypothetical protein